MKQKLYIILLVNMFLLIGKETFAYDCIVDGIYYNRLSSNEVEVTASSIGGTDRHIYTGDIVIPEQITYAGKRFTVTQIGKAAFRYQEYMTSISLPKTIKRIEDNAFEFCKFKSFTLPQSLMYCGKAAFNLITLESIYINSLEHWLSIEVSYTNTNSLPHGLRYYINGEIVTDLIIPKGTKVIPGCRFAYWYDVKSVKIPYGVSSIGFWAFHGCMNLERIEIPNSVKTIGSGAFSYSKIKTIDLPNQLEVLECLDFCQQLTTVKIPESTIRIGNSAFRECKLLKEIKIPQNVTSIDHYAFQYCTNLTDFYLCPENPPTIYKETFDDSHYTWANLYVPQKCASKYKNSKIWNLFYDIKEFNPTNIDNLKDNYKTTQIYTIEGIRKGNLQKGINIIRTNNGTTKKVVVR